MTGPLWKEYIESTTRLCGVWEYCDPAAPKDKILELEAKISEPSCKSVRKDAQKISDLDDAEFQKLGSLVKEYKEKKHELQEKKKLLDAIGELIVESVSGPYAREVEYCRTPYDQLQVLAEACRGPSYEEVKELSAEWLELQQLADLPQVRQYVTRWDTLFDNCTALGLASSSSRRKALGNSLLDSQSPATSWKPLQFQRWFKKAELSSLDQIDSWNSTTGSHSEGDDKSQNEDGRSVDSWDTETGAQSDEEGEGEGDDDGVITW